MEKKNIIIIICFLIIILLILLFLTGRPRTDVYLKNFKISDDGKIMTINVGVSDSSGYIRKMKRTSDRMNYYTFYSTFGINSKIGAKDRFDIELDQNVHEIYFYTGNKEYKKVLEKDSNNNWNIIDNKQ